MRFRTVRVAGVALALLAGQAHAEESPSAKLQSTMDAVFGAGRWRVTGGYRTPAREDELRAQGALTVPPGALSRHSMGRPGAPGAYDVVVDGVTPSQAAARLREAGAPFAKYLAEGTHGTQGPHLHLEPGAAGIQQRGERTPQRQVAYLVADPTPAERAMNSLHEAAVMGDAAAQLRLGEAYAQGRLAPRDLISAYVWTALAASNAGADPSLRRDAAQRLAMLAKDMKPTEISEAQLFARPATKVDPSYERCGSDAGSPGIILLIGESAVPSPAPRRCPRAVSALDDSSGQE